MTIYLNGAKYESGKITAAMSRRAMELNLEALDAAKQAESMKTELDIAKTSSLLDVMLKNIDAKAALICEAFDNAFTQDELLKEKRNEELNTLLQFIVRGN